MRRKFRYDPTTKELVEVTSDRREPIAPQVFGDLPGYESPASGKWIEGRRARREDFKRTGCRPFEGLAAERRMAEDHHRHIERKHEARLDESAHRAWAEAPSDVRRILSKRN